MIVCLDLTWFGVCGLIGGSLGWLVGWLIGCLVGSLVVCSGDCLESHLCMSRLILLTMCVHRYVMCVLCIRLEPVF